MLPVLLLSLLAASAHAQAAAPAAEPAPAIAQQRASPVPAPARGPDARATVELAGLDPAALAIQELAPTADAPFAVGVWPSRPWQGALLVVDVALPEGASGVTGRFLGIDLIWHRTGDGIWRGMGPVPDDARVGRATLQIRARTAAGTKVRKIPLEVLPLAWDTDELRVDPKFSRPSKAARVQIAKDRAAMAAMWKRGSHPAPLFSANFVIPRDDRTTAPYGTRRTFNGTTRSVHRGWDIDGEVGEEIRAPNAGIVTMAQEQYYAGGTLFLDHGGGLYTGYFHMDSFAVKPGDRVQAGDLLGTVGKSGRVTGPHLHWAAKIGGHYIHPASLLLFDFTRPMVRPLPRPAAEGGAQVVPARANR